MKLYKRQIKYVWLGYNDRGSPPIDKETEWIDEDEAYALGIKTYMGHTCCIEKERFIKVKEI